MNPRYLSRFNADYYFAKTSKARLKVIGVCSFADQELRFLSDHSDDSSSKESMNACPQ